MGTITKALNLLNYYSENTHELGLMDFRKLVNTDKATLHRHLTELLDNGFLEQNRKTRKYRLGAAILRLASIRESTFPARRIVSQWVDKLAKDVGELVHASVIQHFEMSPLCFHDYGTGGTRVYFSEADMLPLHATASGLIALSFGDPALLQQTINLNLEKFTEHTTTNQREIEKQVQLTRKNGYAFTEQTFELEVSSIAVPFYETGSFAYGAISIAIPESRMRKKDRSRLAESLWQTSRMISMELGGDIPDQFEKIWR